MFRILRSKPRIRRFGPVSSIGTSGFTWRGYHWQRRTDAGAPQFNGSWDPNNVIGPDVNTNMTLRVTNPSGTFPIAAEFSTVGGTFGFGVYTSQIATRLDQLYKSTVFGGMFTYDNDNSYVTNNEIDAHETSAWGIPGGSVQLEHTYFKNVGGVKTGVTDGVDMPVGTVMTHRMRWQPGKITWDSYQGTGVDGTVILHTVQTTNVGTPAAEQVFFNSWVFSGNGGTPSHAPQQDITINDFSFVAGTPLLSSLTDNYSNSVISPAKWVTVEAGGATVTQTGGQLSIAMPASSTSSTDGELQSVQNYDMTGNGAYSKVVEVPSAATDALALYRIYLDSSNYLQYQYEAGTTYMQSKSNGVNTTVGSFTHNLTTHAWLKIREASGTVYWDTSTNGTAWTNRGSKTNDVDVTQVNFLAAGICFQNETDPGNFIIDDFNTLT